MKNLLTLGRLMTAVLLIGGGGCARSQSLGTAVADALLGRPLDMSLPARFASGDTADECVQADVFYGESRLKPADVRTTVIGPPGQRRVRVEAAVAINEPFVTVSVHAGCRSTVTRNYTLLPQFPSEPLLAAAEVRAALASATPAAPLKLATATAGSTAPMPRPRAVRVPRKPVLAAGPRLKLQPLEVPERDALLRVTHSLAQPEGDASRRAAAALLWQAVNADPQEVMRTTAMLQKMEADLAALRQGTSQARADIASLRARLDQAQHGGGSPTFVQALLLLLAAAAAGAGVLWMRTRHLAAAGGTWYVPAEPQAAQPATVAARSEAEPEAEVPMRVEPEAVAAVPAAAPAPAAAAMADEPSSPECFPPSAEDAILRVETLAATFEEVDFLCSLGLVADAMDILKAYLQDSGSPSPLAYLALMLLCERAEDPAGVAAVRRRYAQVYGVEAPRLPQIAMDGGLDALPELAARVTRAWRGPERLPVLQAALFGVPTPAVPMTLQAVRDLLSLHDLALAEAAGDAGAQRGEPAEDHALAPWADADGATGSGLDLDLGAAPPEPLPEPRPAQVELAPMLEKLQADSARELARRQREQEEAFSAAVASERMPVSRY